MTTMPIAFDRFAHFEDHISPGDVVTLQEVLDTRTVKLPPHSDPLSAVVQRLDGTAPQTIRVFVDQSAPVRASHAAVLDAIRTWAAQHGTHREEFSFDATVTAPGQAFGGGGTTLEGVYAHAADGLNVVLTDGFTPVAWPESPDSWLFVVDTDGAHWMNGHLTAIREGNHHRVVKTPQIQTIVVS